MVLAAVFVMAVIVICRVVAADDDIPRTPAGALGRDQMGEVAICAGQVVHGELRAAQAQRVQHRDYR